MRFTILLRGTYSKIFDRGTLSIWTNVFVMCAWKRCVYTVGLWRPDEPTMFNGALQAAIDETIETLFLRWEKRFYLSPPSDAMTVGREIW